MLYFLVILIVFIVFLVLKITNQDNLNVAASVTRLKACPSFPPSINDEYFFFVFDLETTGLPSKRMVTKSNYKEWPRIVQIAWLILDKDFHLVKEFSSVVKQDSSIPLSATRIHHISDEIAQEKEIVIDEIIERLLSDLSKAKILVAHNMEFDLNVLKSEFYRQHLDISSLEIPLQYCTMKLGTPYCKLPKNNGNRPYFYDDYKYPKLSELVRNCFFRNEPIILLENEHDAFTDTYWTAKCFEHLVKENKVKVEQDYIDVERKRKAEQERVAAIIDDNEVEIHLTNQVHFPKLEDNKEDKIRKFSTFVDSMSLQDIYENIHSDITCNEKGIPIRMDNFDFTYSFNNDYKIKDSYTFKDGSQCFTTYTYHLDTSEDLLFDQARDAERDKCLIKAYNLYTKILLSSETYPLLFYQTVERNSVVLRKLRKYDEDVVLLRQAILNLSIYHKDNFPDLEGWQLDFWETQLKDRINQLKKRLIKSQEKQIRHSKE